ncbi:hypothetical protein BU25DRAFT_413954 [Macroventuria anomochaeta]|uniref:Uncharacterized protein n=1 Tax=Macroventuria anomochaeta TaxID=301207 RepID=A0ACB6RT48_9PLEO|nr:uncharacterized protein BU25DRAFT_413954 [Macroventuria anomochaeta]KAF2624082.1 hypothetical protein BU25DRAFT_413954 [Macroventuria anomochaeta]
MAKGLRASTERANRRKLRANVFGPAEKARAERLHAKLLATINSEKPAPPEKKEMEVDEQATAEAKDDLSKEMDVDTKTSAKKPNRNQNERRTKNQRARKPKNSMTFPTSRGKGALKPFTGKGRVSKRK